MDRLRRELAAGEWLFRRGDRGDCAYVIESGAIDIVADGSNGENKLIARLGPKDVFGEMALAGEGVRSAGAVAANPTTLLLITPEYLRDRLRVADPLLRHVLRTVIARLRGVLDQVYGRGSASAAALPDSAAEADTDRESAFEHLNIERRLALALEREELALHYQPIVRCSDGRVDGFEALLRWPQADGSFLSPAAFIPLAESSGLIVPIGRWIIASAGAALAQFDAAVGRRLYISVNLSAQQFNDPELIPIVRDTIARHALAPKQLTLEVTESLLIERIDQAIGLLNDCRGLGAKVSVDDFGTGFSSLSYLHRLPADVLKLDRVFVRQGEEGTAALKIVRAVTALAHELGMMVVQEGMENETQAERTRSLGVDWAQGYYYSRPLSYDAALDYLTRSEVTTGAG
jgi:EAL domain-containing protein (putative c-di-GMP-specific phosphodiesterase class I)